MATKPRDPLTEAERQEMRERVLNGETYLEVSRIFKCSPRTVEKACVGLCPKKGGNGVPITTKQIEEIAKLRQEGMRVPQISRIVGISITSVTRYSPRSLKNASSPSGGDASYLRKKEKRDEVVAAIYAATPKPAPKPKPVEEFPDGVQRMIKSFRDRGFKEELARSWAIAHYNKTLDRRR